AAVAVAALASPPPSGVLPALASAVLAASGAPVAGLALAAAAADSPTAWLDCSLPAVAEAVAALALAFGGADDSAQAPRPSATASNNVRVGRLPAWSPRRPIRRSCSGRVMHSSLTDAATDRRRAHPSDAPMTPQAA